jgi:hypothetical protein
MLVVNSFSEDLFACEFERQQIKIVICAPVKHATSAIDGCVDQGVCGAAVFGLDVINRLASFHVRVVPEEHMFRPSRSSDRDRGSNSERCGTFLVPFDRLAVEWIL